MPARSIPAEHITGIYETHLSVADLDRSLAFYHGLLGLEIAHRVPARGAAFLWVGGRDAGLLGLWQSGAGPLGMRLHFAFRSSVPGVQQICDNLPEPLGFSGEPVAGPVVIGWMPAITVYARDPDGHSIEFLSLLEEDPDPEFGVQSYSAWLNR